MTTANKPATPEPSAEDLQALQDAIDKAVAEGVAKALADQKAAAAPSVDTKVAADEGPVGRLYLSSSDFVPIWDKDGNELPAVPKHWTADDLPRGASKKKPAKKDAES